MEPKSNPLFSYWHAKRMAIEIGRHYEGMCAEDIASTYGEVKGMKEIPAKGFGGDDDTTMPLALLAAYKSGGLDMTSQEISRVWKRVLPVTWFWRFRQRQLLGLKPPATGQKTEHEGCHIGAMLIADYVGVLSAGEPEKARARAREMGYVCSAGEGIAAGEWVADVCSRIAGGAAAPQAVRDSLTGPFTDDTGRIRSMVQGLVSLHETHPGKMERKDLLAWIIDQCQEPWLWKTLPPGSLGWPEPWVHALPNTGIVAAVWLWSSQSPLEAMLEATRLGWDTDSNAGIVAGVLAARDGLGSIPLDWIEALGPFIPSEVKGFRKAVLADVAAHELI